MWASLLAVIAGMALTGIIDVAVKPRISHLKPAYAVERAVLRAELNRLGYSLVDSLLSEVFDTAQILLVDSPSQGALFLRTTGEAIGGVFRRSGPDSVSFKYKMLTDGLRVFRWQEIGYSPRAELQWNSKIDDGSSNEFAGPGKLAPEEIRIRLTPFFTRHFFEKYGLNWKGVSTESLLRIEESFERLRTEPPPLLSSAIVHRRRVYSILSIENQDAEDIAGMQLRLSKRRHFDSDSRLTLEAWSVGESPLACEQRASDALLIDIPLLKSGDDLQLIVSSQSFYLTAEDVVLTSKRLENVNGAKVWTLLVGTLLISLIIQSSRYMSREKECAG